MRCVNYVEAVSGALDCTKKEKDQGHQQESIESRDNKLQNNRADNDASQDNLVDGTGDG